MKKSIFFILISFVSIISKDGLLAIPKKPNNSGLEIISVNNPITTYQVDKTGNTIKVPEEVPTISKAVKMANDGDRIILSPGKYFEKNIEIDKAITISSEWKLTGDESKIDETIIDSGDKILFSIRADGVEISGLKIINGDHPLDIDSKVIIMHNHFVNNRDAMSFESSGGGYAGYNTVENDRDDGIDLDIRYGQDDHGSNILIEHNSIINSNDDGIEIRLYTYHDQNIYYTIRENIIIGSKNAGIQLISYDIFTGKVFQIHHNIIRGCKTGLGCMEGSNTKEDLSGASKMDELVCFYNNTLAGNQMGATGGNNIIAVNNVVQGNSLGGFKRFGSKSVVLNNLFYLNQGNDFIELSELVNKTGNILDIDPLLDKTSFTPAVNSPCIGAGRVNYEVNGMNLLEINEKKIAGLSTDIGAIEFTTNNKTTSQKQNLIVDAGEDSVLISPSNELILKGKITNDPEVSYNSYWRLEKGPGKVDILNPDKIQTGVIIHQEGIYQFSFVYSNDKQIASDNVTIRYINDGKGKDIFPNDVNKNIIDAEDYSYSYGNVAVIMSPESSENKCVKTEQGDEGQTTFIEYSVGTSENENIYLWLLLRNQNERKSSVQIKFNDKEFDKISVSNRNKWKWMKIPGKINLAAGQWPLLLRNSEGSVLIDKICFSNDPKFIPKSIK